MKLNELAFILFLVFTSRFYAVSQQTFCEEQLLITAQHATTDAGIRDTEDPQNVELEMRLKMRWPFVLSLGESLNGAPNATQTRDGDAFDFPAPTIRTQGQRLTLWATHYYIHNAEAVSRGQPLLDISGKSLGVSLSVRNWCLGAVEGTIRVTGSGNPPQVFNYAGRASRSQLNCAPIVPRLPPGPRAALGKSRFERARGPFGTGTQGMILVPFRTIAVDPQTIPFGTVIYIPEARGQAIILPTGEQATHDGYFYAADTGGAIRGTHIDVFGGIERRNPFPSFVGSNASRTFTAFVINDSQIAERLKRQHLPQ